jgi:ABC-2 type transport system ATP-binding protein
VITFVDGDRRLSTVRAMPRVAVTDLTVVRSRRETLSNVSLGFESGVTAVLGPNGAGKSTLLRTLVGVQAPTSGAMHVEGTDIYGGGRDVLDCYLRRVGWLPQDPGIPPRITATRLVAHAAWLKAIPPERCAAEVSAALELADVSDLAERRVGQLSGGQRRRVALAAALVGGPDVIAVDEPTVGLDPLQRRQFLDRLRDLATDRVVIIATHLLDDVEQCADRWCAVGSGRIVATGDVDRRSAETLAASIAAALASFEVSPTTAPERHA